MACPHSQDTNAPREIHCMYGDFLNYAKLILSPQQDDVGNDDKVRKKQKEVGEAFMCPFYMFPPPQKN